MDREPEDWEEQKRIKAEINKAEMAGDEEDKSNLAYLGTENFTRKKGFTWDADAFRQSGEKFGGGALFFAVVGLIGLVITKYIMRRSLGIVDDIIGLVVFLAIIFGVAGIASAILYVKRANKNANHIFISSVLAIIISIIYLFLRFKM